MIKLLISNSDRAEMSETSFGGKSVKNIGEDFHWPKCSCCKLPMRFLAKLRVDEELHQIFMCQNDPGMCDDWDANGGGNTVVVIKPFELEFVQEPSEGETLRETEHSAKVVSVDANDYEAARSEWAEKNGISPREVLGQVSGEQFNKVLKPNDSSLSVLLRSYTRCLRFWFDRFSRTLRLCVCKVTILYIVVCTLVIRSRKPFKTGRYK